MSVQNKTKEVVTGQLNSVLWRDEVTHDSKKIVHSAILESLVVTCGSETWETNQRNSRIRRLKSVEMD